MVYGELRAESTVPGSEVCGGVGGVGVLSSVCVCGGVGVLSSVCVEGWVVWVCYLVCVWRGGWCGCVI